MIIIKKLVSIMTAFVLMLYGLVGISGNVSDDYAEGKYKNVILMIGDGMSFNNLEATKALRGVDLAMETMPVKAESDINSFIIPYTDSAAGGTALSGGIRVWVKTGENNPYSLITVMIGSKPYYQSEAQGGYYSYNLVIYGGYEGYVNIPFKNFVNLKGESVEVKDFNYIAFKYGENAYVKSDIYLSDLQVYGFKENETFTQENVGIQIDPNKNYEIIESTLFSEAGQEVWDLTKNGKITVKAEQKINIPSSISSAPPSARPSSCGPR